MTSNFWQQCAISALEISKNHFATFDFFVKMKLVSTMSLSKSPKWREAIVAKWRVPKAKPAKLGLLGTSWTPLTQNDWVLRFGRSWHCTTFKKTAC